MSGCGATIFRRREQLGEHDATAEPEGLLRLSSDEYISRFNIRCYLSDVVRQLLESRDDRPLEFIAEYFIAVTRGSHIAQRSYSYVTATLHNRRSFAGVLCLVAASFAAAPPVAATSPTAADAAAVAGALTEGAIVSPEGGGGASAGGEHHHHGVGAAEAGQLVRLLCPDFPEALLASVHATLCAAAAPAAPPAADPWDRDGSGAASGEAAGAVTPFSALCAALGVEVYFGEHVEELHAVFARTPQPAIPALLQEFRCIRPQHRAGARSGTFYGTQSQVAEIPYELLACVARRAACAAPAAAPGTTSVGGGVADAGDGGAAAAQALRPHPPAAAAPPKECEQPTGRRRSNEGAAAPSAAPHDAGSGEDAGNAATGSVVNADRFFAELYRSEDVVRWMHQQHPALDESFGAQSSAGALADAVLQAHDHTVLSGRRRKQRQQRRHSEQQ